ncbi:carbamoyltransferase family protein [Microbaculum marinisediminis]|uniref:Carbamoyltransferase n=1 Tax=Microbaculum marinisediminis TaxID=2931392 RepID=A0AAW5R211_9HYPH|nr:carbamoyltransferase C-terminal domain-containing protein [Microbaculum sp. A6E488]MCT8972893.1 hypothetical protein [Microbaculum sp. A6E488]
MYSLGVNLSHDRAACLVGSDGSVVAIAEERLDREKHSCPVDPLGRIFTSMPLRSIDYCCRAAGIDVEDLDAVVFTNAVVAGPDSLRNLTVSDCVLQAPFSPHSRLYTIKHHLAHGLSAFAPSGFDETAVLVVDKGGSVAGQHRLSDGTSVPLLERATIFDGRDGTLVPVLKVTDRPARLYENCNSIGALYEMATLWLGCTPFDAGKTMGLAPYGSLEHLPTLRRFYSLTDAGYQISPAIQTVGLDLNPGFYAHRFGPPNANSENPSPEYAAVARAAQEAVEEIMVHLARLAVRLTGRRKLAIAGGVGLNCVANSRIRREVDLDDIFVQPAATDDGTAIGAAFYGLGALGGRWPGGNRGAGGKGGPKKNGNDGRKRWPGALGRPYSRTEIEQAIAARPGLASSYRIIDDADLGQVARALDAGRLIAWFTGGSEFGPRALGHRSLLADPRKPGLRSHLNANVKKREQYRPYAASITVDRARDFFHIEHEEPYMIFIHEMKKDFVSAFPSIAHVDNTCRLHTVTKDQNEPFHALLSAFGRISGVPMLLNTSLNGKSEPIVETPDHALDALIRLDLDGLYLDGVFLEKRRRY